MKAKRNFSRLTEESAARGSIGVFGAIVLFIGGVVIWSASCMGSAVVHLVS